MPLDPPACIARSHSASAAGRWRAAAKRRPPPAPQRRRLASIVIQPVRAPLERYVDGTIEAVNQATVSAQTSGRVAEILTTSMTSSRQAR